LLWIQLISFTRANELYQIISDYLLNLKRIQQIQNKNGQLVEAIICYSPIKIHKTDKILSRFPSFVIATKKDKILERTITGIALSVLYDKTKRILENKAQTWNPIVYPIVTKNNFSKITKFKIMKIIKQIYADNDLVFKGTPYTSKRSAITLLSCMDIHTNLIKKCPAWHSDTMFNHYVSVGCITHKSRLLRLPLPILNEFYSHCMAYDFYNVNKATEIKIRPDQSKLIGEDKDSDVESINVEIKYLHTQLELNLNKI
jgi:hypothetical protein